LRDSLEMTTLDSRPVAPAPSDVPAPRGARRRRRERRRLGVAAGVLAAGMLAGAAGAYVQRDSASTPEATSAERTAAPEVRVQPGGEQPRRPLTPDAPLRLWIGGDSLAGSLGPSLGELVATTGVVAPQLDSRVSSGLTSPEFFDWPEHAAEEMARLDPEAVVFLINTNDANAMPPLEADTVASSGENWRTDYAARVDEMLGILVGDSGRPVYWVGTPPMQDEDLDDNVAALNEVVREVAARHPEVTYVDATSLFVDADGDYTSSVTDAEGDRVLLRGADGIHLTPEGGDRMAAPVFDALDAEWRIRAQAVPGHVQPIVETEGSSQVPGTGRDVSRSGSSGSRSSGSRSSGSGSSGSGGSGSATTTTVVVEAPAPDTTPTTTETTPPVDTTPPSTPVEEPTDPVDPADSG
jgi:hypothetical protein